MDHQCTLHTESLLCSDRMQDIRIYVPQLSFHALSDSYVYHHIAEKSVAVHTVGLGQFSCHYKMHSHHHCYNATTFSAPPPSSNRGFF